ncbi:RecB-like helicase [Helicobacter sp. 11S03491-1]|uniref:RecB-like helicase n=1 Tax=Helicobacter sp. 11S03491-1 TaxID=1476196 RepID=UPI000BA58536|nr:RecB-like helicase [Helicobacter sp. 11S03491-1]PAF42021.1 hypothetical protein BKH45_05425 [Helicobacter sp. 11S03491-1]
MDSKQWLALKASAGSGKTFALAMRYIGLLFNGANPNEILTLTFTKKAAFEMNKRISDNLIALKTNKNAQPLIEELQNYGIDPQDIQKNIHHIYEKFLYANTKIMTIDAFLNFILKKFCWYVGISHQYKIEFEDKDKIYQDFLLSLTQKDNQEFLDFCIFQNMSPNSLLDLVFYLDLEYFQFDKYLPPVSSLQTIDIRKDIKSILELAQNIKMIVSQCENASSRAKDAIKTDNIKILTDNLKWLEEGSEYFYFKKLHLQHLEPKFQELRDALKKYYDYSEYLALHKISHFLKLYEKSRRINFNNTLSFGAITLKAYELLQNHFDSDFFYFRLDDKITHILIDEFQDTSMVQYKILKPLIDEIYSGEGRFGERSIFFVGDTKQSIYRFRGSNSELFDHASKNIHQKNLPYNYRSSENVIAYVNDIFRTKIADYIPQKVSPNKNNSFKGYVKICQNDENIYENIWQNLNALLSLGIALREITILCFGNDDVLDIRDYLWAQNSDLQIITETNTKLAHQSEAKIILHAIAFSKTKLEFHKKCAYKLAGLNYHATLQMPLKKPSQSLQAFILEIMETFNLYGKAAQKMLEIACDYDSPDEFQDSIHRLEIGFAPESKKGLQIMTIHKSKGLEFEYVILCDRLKAPRPDTGKLIFDYEGIDLKTIFYKQKQRERIDFEYKKACQKEKQLSEKEKMNVLYVAFTRAKQGLIVIPKEKESSFESLELTPLIMGNPHPSPSQNSKESHPTPLVIEQKNFGRQKGFVKQEDNFQSSASANIIFGEALHKGLEYRIGYGIKEEIIGHILNNQFGFFLSQKSIEDILNLIDKLKKNEMFKSIISQAWIKSEVSYLNKNTLNRIDAMILDKNNQVIILDYKSGIKNQNKHIGQVKKYLEFSKGQFQNQSVKAYVLYVREKIEFTPVI